MVRKYFANKTVITIAHRLHTIMDSDRVMVLDKGRLAEFDTPSNLIAMNGIFTAMIEATGPASAEHLRSIALAKAASVEKESKEGSKDVSKDHSKDDSKDKKKKDKQKDKETNGHSNGNGVENSVDDKPKRKHRKDKLKEVPEEPIVAKSSPAESEAEKSTNKAEHTTSDDE